MKLGISILFAVLLLTIGTAAPAAEPDWSPVDKVFGTTGKSLPGGVYRFGWPRTDMNVTVGGVKVEAALALGSWGAFVATGKAGEAMTMGDLVLLEVEVTPVVNALQAGGLDVLAIHNHLVGEKPQVLYVHFAGHGEPAALARGLKAALEKTKTPLASSGEKVEPSAVDQAILKRLQDALGRTGTMAGRVLQAGVPRADKIEENGMEVPASMG